MEQLQLNKERYGDAISAETEAQETVMRYQRLIFSNLLYFAFI